MRIDRAIVFGGSGFVGRYVVERLADRGAVITVAVREPESAKFLLPLGNVGQIVALRIPVQRPDLIDTAMQGQDVAVISAGILVERGAQTFKAVHVDGPAAIAKAAREAGVKRLVLVSAIGAAPDALSDYARSKWAGEQAVREEFPDATILRPSIIFGAEDRFFNLFAGLARYTPALPLFGGGTTRFQPVYVGDAADALMAAIDARSAAGATYALGGPEIMTFKELMQRMLRTIGRRRLLVPVPFAAGEALAALLSLMPQPLLTRDQLRQLRSDNVVGGAGDIRTLADLAITPTAMEAILPGYLARYRRGGRIGRLQLA